MPSCPQQHRQATGRFHAVLIEILRKKSCVKHPLGIVLLWPGGGTMEKHFLVFTMTSGMPYGQSVRFQRTEPGYRQSRFGVLTAIMLIFVSTVLLVSGDVHPHPGPLPLPLPPPGASQEVPEQHGESNTSDSSMQGLHQCIAVSVTEAVKSAMKELRDQQTSQYEAWKSYQETQTKRLESQMQQLGNILSEQLGGIERRQAAIEDELEFMTARCERLQEENEGLWKQVDLLKEKCDSLENHSRRNNLLFFGIQKDKASESWEECEQKVMTVIKEGMGLQEDIPIERAHRTRKGDGVIVKFLSFKSKDLILKNAKKMKATEKYRNVYVREDFSALVRKKRQGLRQKANQLFDGGQKPRMRFDKLFTEEGVFTYDTDKEEVVKLSRDRAEERKERHDDVEEERRNTSEAWNTSAWQEREADYTPVDFSDSSDPSRDSFTRPSSQVNRASPKSTSEYPNSNQSEEKPASRKTEGQSLREETQTTQREGACEQFRYIPPSHSPSPSGPMLTRQRASSVTQKDRPSARANTLHNWMKPTQGHTKGAVGGRAGEGLSGGKGGKRKGGGDAGRRDGGGTVLGKSDKNERRESGGAGRGRGGNSINKP